MLKLTTGEHFESDWLLIEPKSALLEPTKSVYLFDTPGRSYSSHYQFDANDENPSTTRNLYHAYWMQIHVQSYLMRC